MKSASTSEALASYHIEATLSCSLVAKLSSEKLCKTLSTVEILNIYSLNWNNLAQQVFKFRHVHLLQVCLMRKEHLAWLLSTTLSEWSITVFLRSFSISRFIKVSFWLVLSWSSSWAGLGYHWFIQRSIDGSVELVLRLVFCLFLFLPRLLDFLLVPWFLWATSIWSCVLLLILEVLVLVGLLPLSSSSTFCRRWHI